MTKCMLAQQVHTVLLLSSLSVEKLNLEVKDLVRWRYGPSKHMVPHIPFKRCSQLSPMMFQGELKCIKISLMETTKWMRISLSHSTYSQKRFDHLELT